MTPSAPQARPLPAAARRSQALVVALLAALAVAVAVIWFRYGEADPRLAPSRAWDALLWLSAAGFLAVGLWTAWDKLASLAR